MHSSPTLTTNIALAYALQGTVVYIYDGDTIKLKTENQYYRIRLASIDAPEKSQPYGLEATILLRRLVQNKTVLANVIDTDKYGRKIAYIKLESQDISSIMLANGAAWHYKAFDKTSAQYDLHYALEQEAKANKRGLWAQDYPIAPWMWRRNIANRKPSENMPQLIHLNFSAISLRINPESTFSITRSVKETPGL